MKPILISSIILSSLLMAPLSANADPDKERHHRPHPQQTHSHSYTAYGKVIHTKPLVRYVEVQVPHKECYTTQPQPHHHTPQYPSHTSSNNGPVIVGSVLSGTINPNSRLSKNAPTPETKQFKGDNRHHHEHEKCRTVYETHREKQIDGYLVTYRYRGKRFTTELPYDPGDKIALNISVTPARR